MPEPIPIRPDGLQIDDNPALQARFWRVQRIAWGLFALALIGALLGLTGRSGPFAQAQVGIGTTEITYPRITRIGVPSSITLLFTEATTGPEIALGPDLTRLIQIDGILPRPAMESGGGTLRFAFFPDSGLPYRITLNLHPQAAGIARYTIATEQGAITATTLVLP